MKKIFIVSLYLTVTVIANATVRTVCNLPAPSAQYATIQAAVDASASGDTVFVQGSGQSYGVFTIADKRLVIIGPGWKPLKNLPQLVANVQNCTLTGVASSGTELQGLTFRDGYTDAVNIQGGVAISNLKFVRNHFFKSVVIGGGGNGIYNNYLFEGNWFDQGWIAMGGYGTSFTSNFIIRNNIFYNARINGFVNASSTMVDHNLFYYSGLFYAFGSNASYPSVNFTIQNNIFCRAEPIYGTSGNGGAKNCIFKNNITFNTNATAPWTLNGNIDGGGNILNQDPLMTAQTQVNSGINDPLLNFTIASGPANNKATDGKDMGLLFDNSGNLNWSNSRNSRLPYVYDLNILNPNIAPGGTLNITLEARKSN